MNDRKLKIAVVGAGPAGAAHGAAFCACGRAEVVRVVSRTRESARRLAEEWGDRAGAALAPFGERADELAALVRLMLDRKR